MLTGSSGYLAGLTSTAQRSGVPWRMSETNSLNSAGSSGPLGTANGYGSALWGLDDMFTIAYGGGAGVNMSGISNDATGYQPISFNGNVVSSVNPLYYGMLLFAQAGTGTLLNATVNAGSLNVSAYAVQTSTGGINLVIVNKDASNNLQVTVSLPQIYANARLQVLTQATSGNTESM